MKSAYLIFGAVIVTAAQTVSQPVGQPSAQPPDSMGWTRARWGMTSAQVRAAVPEVASIDSLPAADRTFSGGAVAHLGIQHYDIDGTNWRVFLLFDSTDRLARVVVQPVDRGDAGIALFVRIENLLFQKYGRPFDRTYGDNTQSRSSVWAFPTTTITLDLLESKTRASTLRFLNLEYSRRPAALDRL